MNFAENNRISHRQLYRQIILSFLAPFLLCLPGRRGLLGIPGIIGTVTAVVLLLFYVIFLIRLAPYFGDLYKTAGGFWARVIGLFFLAFVIITAAFLLHVLGEVIPVSLLSGVPSFWIMLLAVLVCGSGTHKGMQRRGRIAEVSGGVLLWSVILMMLLCLGQSKASYFMEMVHAFPAEGVSVWRDCYVVLCAFSGLGLLPFILDEVGKQGSAGKAAAFGILTLGGILVGMLILLPAVFGWERLNAETYPMLPLLDGANLPGNVLARFDVLWMGFLIYSILFAIGSLFHYGHQIIRRTGLGTGRIWMAAAAFFLSLATFEGAGIKEYYGTYVAYVFVPGLLLCQLFIMFFCRGRRRKRITGAVASLLVMVLFFCGCAGVEPEKRMYPLALGVDVTEDNFSVSYSMPDLPKATGQNKEEEGSSNDRLTIEGRDFNEIERLYNRSQEKYLDMGHLQVLVLGDELLGGDRWVELLDYLHQEPYVGENVYVFCTSDVKAALSCSGERGTSLGEYLLGLMENRTSGQELRKVTLREVYYQRYESGTLPALPRIVPGENQLQVLVE